LINHNNEKEGRYLARMSTKREGGRFVNGGEFRGGGINVGKVWRGGIPGLAKKTTLTLAEKD